MRTDLIAEIGVNHNGNVKLAHSMLDAAADNGANIVKFQTHIVSKEMIRNLSEHVSIFPNLYEHIDALSLDFIAMKELKDHADSKGIQFLSTPFSVEAVDWLEKVGVDQYKVGSGEADNFLLLDKIISTKKHIFISTGMSSINEVKEIVEFLQLRNAKYTLMQCTSEYPASCEVVNLKVIETYKQLFQCQVGFSDHSLNIYNAIASISLGAVAIEKHFTTDKMLPGTDQAASITPDDLRVLSEAIDIVEKSLGSGCKNDFTIDTEVSKLFKHCVVAARDIPEGKVVSFEDITAKRPLAGIPAKEYQTVIGSIAKHKILNDIPITYSMLSKNRRV